MKIAIKIENFYIKTLHW